VITNVLDATQTIVAIPLDCKSLLALAPVCAQYIVTPDPLLISIVAPLA
jgi:hypothetical protein